MEVRGELGSKACRRGERIRGVDGKWGEKKGRAVREKWGKEEGRRAKEKGGGGREEVREKWEGREVRKNCMGEGEGKGMEVREKWGKERGREWK